MLWAIVCTEPMILSRWVWDEDKQDQIWTTSEVPANTIMNIIEYDGVTPYTPPEGTVLMEVEDGKNIGDLAS